MKNVLPAGASLQGIEYSTAYATHLQPSQPGVVSRHMRYVECLQDLGVVVTIGRFKAVTGRACAVCGAPIVRHEEKETDVAIAASMMAAFATDACDDVHRRTSLKQCFAFQLPDPFATADGRIIARPSAW